MYYRNTNAALLVFDITHYYMFTSIKSWVKDLQRNVGELLVLCIVGNKTDLEPQRKVPKEEALQCTQSIGGTYFEVSALHDQELQRNVGEPLVLCIVGNKTDLEPQRKVPKEEALQCTQSIGGTYFEVSALHDQELQRNVEEPLVLCIVGNKTELEPQRKVPKEEVLQCTQSIGGTYFEVSALHNQGIKKVFLNIAMGLMNLSKDSLVTRLQVYDLMERPDTALVWLWHDDQRPRRNGSRRDRQAFPLLLNLMYLYTLRCLPQKTLSS